MKGSKWFLFQFLVVCIAGGLIVTYVRSCEKRKTYGYFKETRKESVKDTDQKEQAVSSLEVLAEQNQEEEAAEKKVFLTFDDGPSEVTETVLKLLDDQEIKATFFLIGEQITEETEETVRHMAEEGHEIGIHTFTHESDEIYASAQSYVEDVVKTSKRIEEVTGKKPVYYRFPWGSVNNYISGYRKEVIETLKGMGYEYVDWNVSGEDSVGNPSVQSIYSNVRKDYDKYNEPVVLLHDSSSNQLTAETLPDIINLFQSAGYQFGAMGERSCPYQWCRD